MGIKRLGRGGTCGVLFKVTLLESGYTFVSKQGDGLSLHLGRSERGGCLRTFAAYPRHICVGVSRGNQPQVNEPDLLLRPPSLRRTHDISVVRMASSPRGRCWTGTA